MSQIDFNKDSKQVLFDLINNRNNTQLLASDFTLSNPSVYTGSKPDVNTMITLIPEAGTGFYGSCNIYYSRMSLETVLSSKPFSYNPQAETTLFDLIPKLNEVYGIYLKEEDLIDMPIPAYDPLHPTAPRDVLISAQSTSYFFCDAYTLTLGASNVPVQDVDGLNRLYYLYIDGYALEEIEKSMISLNQDGSRNNDFNFLSNCSNFQKYDLVRVENLNNGFVLNGSFSFDYVDSTQTLISVTDVSSVLIDKTGFVTSTQATPYFDGLTCKFYENNWVAFKYAVDPALMMQNGGLVRYDLNGQKDTTFKPKTTYLPKLVRITDDGKIYTVSGAFLMPDPYNNFIVTNQIRIDRLLPSGDLDPEWNVVYIKSSDANYSSIAIYDAIPLATNGLMIYFKPISGLNNGSPVPMINGVKLVSLNVNESIIYTWNPLARLFSDGSLDRTFNSLLPQFNEGTVMKQVAGTMFEDRNYLVSGQNSIVAMTYRVNPITNYEHLQPLQYNNAGQMNLFAGNYYIAQFKWSNLKDLFAQTNSEFIAYGLLQTPQINGTLSAPFSALVRYFANTAIDKVLWKSPGPNGTSNPILNRVFVDQYL